jgi:hypothetical protein
MAQNFSIPDSRTAVTNEKTKDFSLPWLLFIQNLFASTTSGGNVGTATQVLHGGGAGYSPVNLATDVTVTPSTVGQILIVQSSSSVTYNSVNGDASLSKSGLLTVSGSNGVSFVTSAFIDTTNAANITSGKLPNTRTSGLSVTIVTAQLTAVTGSQGFMIFSNGLLTSQAQAT